MTSTLTARCLCGTNTFSCHVPTSKLPLEANFCHCHSCRHATGALAFPACDWPAALPENLEGCTRFAFSGTANIYFCATCGTWMFWHSDTIPWTGVTIAVLDDPAASCRFKGHMFVPDTIDGGMSVFLERCHGQTMKRFVGHPGEGDVDDNEARFSLREDKPSGLSERLQAYCKCKGVQFQVSRLDHDSVHEPDPSQSTASATAVLESGQKVKFPARICVCDSCRLASGMECMPWSSIPIANLRLTNGEPLPDPPIFGTIKHYRSSERSDRYFCGSCGATVFRRSDGNPGLLDAAVGLLNAPSGARAEEWLDWHTQDVSNVADGVKRGSFAEDLAEGIKAWGAGNLKT